MPGALELTRAGIRSSLFDENRVGVPQVSGASGPLADLMFDPQTAGGLLASVNASDADDLVARLQEAGYQAAIIGRMIDAPGQVVLLD